MQPWHWHRCAFLIVNLYPRLKGFSRVCELVLELRHCSLASPACIDLLPVGTVETDHKAYYGARSGVRAAYELSACIHLPTEARARTQTLCPPPQRLMWRQSHGFQASGSVNQNQTLILTALNPPPGRCGCLLAACWSLICSFAFLAAYLFLPCVTSFQVLVSAVCLLICGLCWLDNAHCNWTGTLEHRGKLASQTRALMRRSCRRSYTHLQCFADTKISVTRSCELRNECEVSIKHDWIRRVLLHKSSAVAQAACLNCLC